MQWRVENIDSQPQWTFSAECNSKFRCVCVQMKPSKYHYTSYVNLHLSACVAEFVSSNDAAITVWLCIQNIMKWTLPSVNSAKKSIEATVSHYSHLFCWKLCLWHSLCRSMLLEVECWVGAAWHRIVTRSTYFAVQKKQNYFVSFFFCLHSIRKMKNRQISFYILINFYWFISRSCERNRFNVKFWL